MEYKESIKYLTKFIKYFVSGFIFNYEVKKFRSSSGEKIFIQGLLSRTFF